MDKLQEVKDMLITKFHKLSRKLANGHPFEDYENMQEVMMTLIFLENNDVLRYQMEVYLDQALVDLLIQ